MTEKQTTHTPGPWETPGLSNPYLDEWSVQAKASARGIAAIWNYSRTTENLANARLIVAAPDLLEALKDCCEALRRAGADGELRIAKAAIAKAEGESP